MKFVVRNIKRIIRLFFALQLTGIFKLIKNYNSKSVNVILVPTYIKGYFLNSLEHDFVLAGVLVNAGKDYRFVHLRNYKKIHDSFVIYNPHEVFGVGYVNYSKRLTDIVRELEMNNNSVFYPSNDIEWWENKTFMHTKFESLGIRCPETHIISLMEYKGNQELPLSFPFLIKEEHSCAAQGVHKVNTRAEFDRIVSSVSFKLRNENIIIQKLIKMHCDLRVILIRSEIVLHYWRVNPSEEWKPTSTSHGSNVDFVTFPEQWREYIIQAFKKLNITTGAFDITWDDDDLSTEPYFLEISPSYQPNPPMNVIGKGFTYGQWKKKLLMNDSWDEHYIKIIYSIKEKLLLPIINKSSQ